MEGQKPPKKRKQYKESLTGILEELNDLRKEDLGYMRKLLIWVAVICSVGGVLSLTGGILSILGG